MSLLRHGAMNKLFAGCYAPSTLGSYLRTFTFGHVRQLQSAARAFLGNLSAQVPLIGTPAAGDFVYVDVDDTIIEVFGHQKQGAGFGYSGVRGLNALIGIASSPGHAPVIVAQRLRKGSASSARGAASFIAASLATSRSLGTHGRFLVRADSAYYNQSAVARALKHGADMSVTVRMNPSIKKAITAIPEEKWETIKYPQAIFDEDSRTWISKAEVAEADYTAFSSKKKTERIPGRLIVRRIPELNKAKIISGQQEAFKLHRYHGVFSTVSKDLLGTVDMDKTHRQHAVIEAVNAELKDGPLAHLPSGNFSANAAWLHAATIAYNLTRAAGILAAGSFTRAKMGTLRSKLILVPARIASSARKIKLHLPQNWPWAEPWDRLFTSVQGPPQAA
ncbi:hypothetical protein E9229_000359 [Paeniglutamicibacter cryotolerans]|uniref:Transposase DDE domain-containing protein n=1 Tax=Paeniglutamicibacter cryotolerans TaxID=670079 RepID=A0A839QDB7_9MICC|nr:hypothetical protein [Paeniglutamicibacter cryotolerans]